MGSRFVPISVGILSGMMGVAAFGQNLLDADPNSATFNNPSFERPDVANFAPGSVKWVADGPSIDVGFGFPIIAGCGTFENTPPGSPDHLGNIDGTQAAWLFANSFPDQVTGQVKDHSWTQVTQLTYQVGQKYDLAVGLALATSPPPVNSVFTLSLFAVDAGSPGGEIALASLSLQNDGTTPVNTEDFYAFHATTDPIAGAAIGKPIGIRFMTHTPPASPALSGQWDLDNVQLTTVPEPTGLALIAGAAGLLGARFRRRR